MNFEEKEHTISKLVKAFMGGSLVRNEEYQRGEAWSLVQKAAFIDSVFRCYPIPAIFLHVVESAGLEDNPSKKYEIVDGQQRLTALRDFRKGNFKLLDVGPHSRLRLPAGVQAVDAPWAGKQFDELDSRLKEKFENTRIRVFEIGSATLPDEIRDLFIRLQSGTALSRQQIRDAWPGNLGPFVERLAGKLTRQPSHRLFNVIDKRGAKMEDEEQKDHRVGDRQVCAQLLRVYLAREYDPRAYPSVSANELDAMYREQTNFDPNGSSAARFTKLLGRAADVFEQVKAERKSKSKFRRLEVTAVVMFLQDVTKNEQVKVDRKSVNDLAAMIANAPEDAPSGKSTSGRTLEKYYGWWRERVAVNFGISLDSRRLFDDGQKKEIRSLAKDLCHVCNEEVMIGDDEYDHFPIPHRDGGRTEVNNGKLVHKRCHARGRPSED